MSAEQSFAGSPPGARRQVGDQEGQQCNYRSHGRQFAHNRAQAQGGGL